ncbi:MAG TPA: DUF1800 domain-containing protein [Candidatus Acidoferrum sp.]|nr:DUF1800 domain-containing protein [Candidatus Acidoferrum sp.]
MTRKPRRAACPRSANVELTFSLALLSLFLPALFAWSAPRGIAGDPVLSASSIKLNKRFKGNLPITELTEDEAILHALNRLGYGPRPGEIERVRAMGLEKWIDQQLDPASIDDSALDQRLDQYLTISMSSKQLLELFPRPGELVKQQGLTKEQVEAQRRQEQQEAVAQLKPTGDPNIDKANEALARMVGPNRIVAELAMAKLDRAIYSNRQLETVMEDFWFNHFNVYAEKGEDRWLLTSYVRDTIRPNSMGKFRDLLLATAKSPAMLFFLDNWLSADPQAVALHREQMELRRARFGATLADFAPPAGASPKKEERGLNENYGREVMELHTVGVDAGYTQQDVIEMARALTGWTIHEPRRDPEFFFDNRFHALGSMTVMGHKFHAGGIEDGEQALGFLASNPNTAHHISLELARHFVSDNPPTSIVDRMAKTYESTGGDIRSVLRTMIYSPEFWSKDAYRAKIKTPFELVASTARALDANVEVTLPLVAWVGRMGEPLFRCQPPTGYSDVAQTWVNAGALLNRMNFALAFATDHMAGAKVDLSSLMGQDASSNPSDALAKTIDSFLDDQIAAGTRQTLEARLNDPQILQARLDDPVKQVNEGLIAGLVLGSPEFQRR